MGATANLSGASQFPFSPAFSTQSSTNRSQRKSCGNLTSSCRPLRQRVGQEIEHFLAELGVDPSNALRSSSYVLIREMLLETDMLSVMPRSMMLGDLVRGTLRVVPMPMPAPLRPANHLATRRATLAPVPFVYRLSARLPFRDRIVRALRRYNEW